VDEERGLVLRELALSLPDMTLSGRQLCDFELLATGAFSPLKGFMVRADYESVLDRMRLQDDTLWPVPVCLDVSETLTRTVEAGQSIALRDEEGFLLGVMHVEDIWSVEREKESLKVFGTLDPTHPGVEHVFNKTKDYYIGGEIEAISPPLHFDSRQLRMTPAEVRRMAKKLAWQRVVGFQTENPIHRPQFEMTIRAMRLAKANLLILPVAGVTKPGDFDHYTRVRCYRKVASHYPPDSFLMNLLPLAMRMAGPKETVLHAIISKNYGCNYFIVGRNHAGPGFDSQGQPFYGGDDACKLAGELSDEIGVKIIPFEEMVYLPFEDEYRLVDQVPEGTQAISLSGSDIRTRILSGKRIPEWATFPEVVEELRRAYPPPGKQGFTVFFTGLSGSGK
jgi:sulfate adenylyltransferase